MRAWWWLIAALLLAAAPARADDLRPGYLELVERAPDQWRMVWKAPVLGGLATRATPALPRGCRIETTRSELAGAALVSVSEVRCNAPLAGRQVGLDGIDAAFTDALVRIAPLGRPVQAARLTPDQSRVTVATTPDRYQVLRSYFGIGVEHILLGFDHLLFVLALVLLIRGGWQVAGAVTAFTLAHSLTLAATTLGVLSVPRRPVEICIALSIVFVASEIVRARASPPSLAVRAPWLVAFAFGLLHGLGFAAALAEIGLPHGEVPMALLAFNLGVEAGQLLIVVVALSAIALLTRFAAALVQPTRLASAYAIGGLASFWMIERAVGWSAR